MAYSARGILSGQFMTSKTSAGALAGTIAGASLALFFCGLGTSARADTIPYPNPGSPNPATYSFTAAFTGDVIAYFAGSSASFENTLGLQINGVSTGIFGLNNKTSMVEKASVLALPMPAMSWPLLFITSCPETEH